MAAFDELLKDPTAAIRIAMIIRPRANQTGEPTIYLTSAPKLQSEPGDGYGNVQFRASMLGGLKSTRQLGSKPSGGGDSVAAFVGASSWSYGDIQVEVHSTIGDGVNHPALVLLDDANANGRPVEFLAGGDYLPGTDRLPYPLAEYRRIAGGLVRQARRTGPGIITIAWSGDKVLGEQPANEELYRGFGTAARIPDAEALEATATNAAFTLSAGTLEIVAPVRSLPVVSGNLIKHSSDDYGIAIDSAGRLGILHDGGLISWSASPVVGGAVALGQSLFASLSFGSGVMRLYAGRRAEFVQEVATFNGTPAPALGGICIGGAAGLSLDVWDARAWSTERTLPQITTFADTPIIDALTTPEVIEQWKAQEGTGDIVRGFKGVSDLAYSSAGLEWISSLEGEDLDVFPDATALAGVQKTRGFGAPYNAPVVMVSQPFAIYQASAPAPLGDLFKLKNRGAPLSPAEIVTTASLGDITFLQSNATFTIVGGGLTFKRFVSGMAAPSALGQKIIVSNSGPWDGTYRVGVGGVTAAGSKMRIVNEFGVALAPAPISGSLPAGSVIEADPDEVQYFYDLPTATFDLPQESVEALTVDAVYEGGAALTASQLVAIGLGEVPEGSFQVDPVVAGITGDGWTLRDIVDAGLRSAIGWVAEKRGGGYRIGTHGDQGIAPEDIKVAIIGGDADDVFSDGDGVPRPPIVGKWVSSPNVDPSVEASWRVTLAYGRNWHPFQTGTTTPSIPAGERQRLETEWQKAWRDLGPVRDVTPVGVPENLIETWIRYAQGANRVLDEVAVPLFSTTPKYISGRVVGLPMLALELGDVIYVQDDEPAVGILEPRRAVVVFLEEDTGANETGVEAYLLAD